VTWHRTSPVSIIYHLLNVFKGMVNVWPALAGFAFIERSREQLLTYGLPSLVVVLILLAVLNYWFFQFSFDEGKIQLRSGVVSRKRLTLNFDRVQEANLQQSLYFRPFDLWTVGLESAGSQVQEIQIPGIDRSLAETIKGYHLSQKSHALSQDEEARSDGTQDSGSQNGSFATQATPPPKASMLRYQLSLGLPDLIRFGLMHNSMIYVLVVAMGAASQSPDMLQRLGDAIGLDALRDAISTSLQHSLLGAVLATMGVVLLSMILLYSVSVFLAVLKYWGYDLTVEDERLQYRAGLLNKVRRSFKHHKLQSVEVSQGLIGRFLQRYTIRLHQTNEVALPGINDARGFVIPVLSVAELTALKAFLHIDAVNWQRANPMRIVWRTLGLGVPLTGLVVGSALMGQSISAAYALLPMPVLAVLFAGIWYRSGYAFSEHWMAHRQGLLGCRYTYVPCTKVQMMDLTQGPLLRLHDAATLLVYNGADVQRFEFISSAVLMPAKARISALVAQSRTRWM
ncbi:MAG: putative membrane protein, partial [Candidatus Azotimanducaceae bacterium]